MSAISRERVPSKCPLPNHPLLSVLGEKVPTFSFLYKTIFIAVYQRLSNLLSILYIVFFYLENWREKLMVIFYGILTTQICHFRWNFSFPDRSFSIEFGRFDKKYYFLSRMVSINQSLSMKFFISLMNYFQGSLMC